MADDAAAYAEVSGELEEINQNRHDMMRDDFIHFVLNTYANPTLASHLRQEMPGGAIRADDWEYARWIENSIRKHIHPDNF
eukprot:CAMPEP_0170463912 /NCGR_PEP_ID=MMETSP0123-20130129/8840_1 /TAXON_ID=182087 /ORGANISM="Favella ehrenbergii, Strain Fehren 1" /LENGTH=80 /DNA_ID=CAMNT_0010729451 /DNA_START=57 /DNA_END=299 /DNA_ORIENTATION=-